MTTSAPKSWALIESNTGRLLAVDANAAKEFSNIDSAKGLLEQLPKLSESEWAAFLDQNDKNTREIVTVLRQNDGVISQIRLIISPMSGPVGELLLLAIEQLKEEPQPYIHRDALTGLPDRLELANRYSQWQQRTSAEEIPLALLFLDLDNFKQINDQYGHAAGDTVLTTLASRWQNCVRDDDIVVRYGGDEFVVLLPSVKKRVQADPIVERLVAAAEQPITIDQEKFTLGVTIGVAIAEDQTTTLSQLIQAADRDMYRSKTAK